jgi:hypothetical protein
MTIYLCDEFTAGKKEGIDYGKLMRSHQNFGQEKQNKIFFLLVILINRRETIIIHVSIYTYIYIYPLRNHHAIRPAS